MKPKKPCLLRQRLPFFILRNESNREPREGFSAFDRPDSGFPREFPCMYIYVCICVRSSVAFVPFVGLDIQILRVKQQQQSNVPQFLEFSMS